MRAKLGVFVTLAATLLVFSVSTFAHHDNAAHDTGTSLTVKGTVTDFRFINPHCQVYFDIKNSKGEVEHWQAELTAPNKLSRAGWTKHSLNPGDEITVTGFQGKNGGHSIWIRKLVGPDGQPMQLSED
jgi:hypothetical protein